MQDAPSAALVVQHGPQQRTPGEVEGTEVGGVRVRAGVVGQADARRPVLDVPAGARAGVVGDEAGAQGVVVGDQVVQRLFQRRRVQVVRHVDGQRLGVVAGALGGGAEQPVLDGCQGGRAGGRLRGRGGLAGASGGVRAAGEGGDRLVPVDVPGGQGQPLLPGAGHHLDAEDGVAAEFEEVVVDADAFHAQHLGPDRGERAFGGRAGRDMPYRAHGGAGVGEPGAVELAVRVERQGVEHDDGRRHHGSGQRTAEFPAYGLGFDPLPGGRDDVAGQAPVAVGVGGDGGRRLGDARAAAQRVLHLAQFDPEAAHLDLLVDPADVLQSAVGAAAHQVAGAVHALPRRAERIGDEPGGGQSGPVQVAAGQSAASEVQLACDTDRLGPQGAVEDIGPCERHGSADGRGLLRQPVTGEPGGGVHGGLGGPVDVGDTASGQGGAQVVQRLCGQGLPGQDDGVRGDGCRTARDQTGDDRRDCAEQPGAPGAGAVGEGRQIGDHLDGAAGRQRAQQLEHGDVEVEGGGGDHVVQAGGPEPLLRPRGQRGDRAVGDDDPLGAAGRTGGVDDVRGVVRQQRPGTVGVGEVRVGHGRVGAVLQEQGGAVGGQGGGGLPGGEDEGGPGVGEHEADALGRIAGVDGEITRARGEHRPQHGHEVGGARQAQRHQGLRARAAREELPGQPVGAPGDLGVVEPDRAADHGGTVRGAGRLGAEQVGQRAVAGVPGPAGGRVPGVHQGALFLGREHGQLGQRAARSVRHALQQAVQVGGQPGHGGGVEQVRVELGGQHAAAVGVGGELQDQVEAGRRAGQRVLGEAQSAGQRGHGQGGLLHDEGLHQRGAARVAGRGQLLDHPVERHPVVGEGVQYGRPHALHEPVHGGPFVDVAPQHHRVGEEARHVLQVAPAAPGGDGAERDVPLPRVAGEEQRGGPREEGEHRGAAPCRQLPQPGHQLGGQRVPVGRSGGGAHGGTRPVGGQLQLLRARQVPSPVGQVGGIGLRGPLPVLPHGEVRVLHGWLGQVVGFAGGLRVVEGGELSGEDAHRPAVGDDVVLGQEQQVVLGGEPDEQRAGERAGREVEGTAQFLGEQRLRRVAAARFGYVGEVGRAQGQVGLRRDTLGALPVGRGEGGAQGGVAGGEAAQGAAQRVGVQGAAQPQGNAGVVLGAALGEVVQVPEPPLRAGQRQGAVEGHRRYRLRRRGGRRVAQQGGQGGDRPRGEDVPDGQPDTQFVPDPGQCTGGEDRFTAEVEEVVRHTDGVDAQHLRPDPREGPLARRTRRDVPLRDGPLRRGQGPPVDLVLRRERHPVEDHDGRRHHVGGQYGGHG